MKIQLLTLKINADKKQEILDELRSRIAKKEKTFIVTPNPEFFYQTFWDYEFERILNTADFALPDGIGILWAAYYLNIPLKATSYYGRIAQAFWQLLYSLAEIVLAPNKIHSVIPERIAGSDFFWDLATLAQEQNLKVFLLGGFGETPKLVAKKLKDKYPNLKITGTSNEGPENKNLVKEINASGADILFVSFGQVRQERWIQENLKNLNVLVAIGVGGTFDYVSGVRPLAPRIMRNAGLEWLYRLITQPRRIKRIWHAIFGFSLGVMRHKIFSSMPYRENVVGVILNQQNQVFVGDRLFKDYEKNHKEYWQFPQGGVDKDEKPEDAVLREIFEETSMHNLTILKRAKAKNEYLWSHGRRELFFNKLKYRGQRQTLFILKFTGEDSEINLAAHDKEFTKYKWVGIDQLIETLHPFRKHVAELVMPDLKEIENAG